MAKKQEHHPEPLDALDVRILDLLQQDALLPVQEIAKRVGSSKSVVWRRVQGYVDSGLIRERVAVLDHKQAGFGIMVFTQVKVAQHGRDRLPAFVEAVRRFPQVIECHTLLGDVDFLLKIVVRDMEEYEQFIWSKLMRIEGVQDLKSSISLTKFVYTHRLPIHT